MVLRHILRGEWNQIANLCVCVGGCWRQEKIQLVKLAQHSLLDFCLLHICELQMAEKDHNPIANSVLKHQHRPKLLSFTLHLPSSFFTNTQEFGRMPTLYSFGWAS